MKLSDAIEKGRGKINFNPKYWYVPVKVKHVPDAPCGCLLGLGIAGAGLIDGVYEAAMIWPWLSKQGESNRLHGCYPFPPGPNYASEISCLAKDVAAGKVTIDEAIDQIRIWESVMDPSPESEVKLEDKETVNAKS